MNKVRHDYPPSKHSLKVRNNVVQAGLTDSQYFIIRTKTNKERADAVRGKNPHSIVGRDKFGWVHCTIIVNTAKLTMSV